MEARIQTVSVGSIGRLLVRGSEEPSAFGKDPVARPVRIGLRGLEGDHQAEREVHGGPDQAVLAYPMEHYPFWEQRLGHPLAVPAFGENLTTEGLLESEVRIGDRYRLAEVLLEVVKARKPCRKLAAFHEEPRMKAWFRETGFTGIFLRCLEPGSVAAGVHLTLETRDEGAPTVAEAFFKGLG